MIFYTWVLFFAPRMPPVQRDPILITENFFQKVICYTGVGPILREERRGPICLLPLDYEQRLKLLSGISIESNHRLLLLNYMYKIISSNILIDGFTYNRLPSITRGLTSKIYLPSCRTNMRKYFSLLRFISIWNSLAPEPSKLVSLAAFKRILMDSLHEPQA